MFGLFKKKRLKLVAIDFSHKGALHAEIEIERDSSDFARLQIILGNQKEQPAKILMRWPKYYDAPIFDFKFSKDKGNIRSAYTKGIQVITLDIGPYRNCPGWNNFEKRTKMAEGFILHFIPEDLDFFDDMDVVEDIVENKVENALIVRKL